MSAFEWTEAELSQDAQAILAYARKWGEPFSRTEIVDVAPGAAWDPMSYYPRTMAKPDPMRELVRAGLIEVAEERPVQAKGRRGGHTYKLYRLTDGPRSLAELLDWLIAEVRTDCKIDAAPNFEPAPGTEVAALRAEILERFGK